MLIANLRYRRNLVRLAEQDSLTGLPNRRRTGEIATTALSSATIRHQPVTIALIDLDHFKSINDRCGHVLGDQVLKEFGKLTRKVLRTSNTLGRWGGEEFLLILPDAPLDTATNHRMKSLPQPMQRSTRQRMADEISSDSTMRPTELPVPCTPSVIWRSLTRAPLCEGIRSRKL